MAEIDSGVMQYLASREPAGDTPQDIQQLTPVDRQGLSQQYFQKDAPEWARVAAQILPFIMPGMVSGAGSLQAAQQPGAQPETSWGQILTMLPAFLGIGGQALSRAPWGRLGGKMQPLPESAIRGPEGQLTKLYHGTNVPYKDFDMQYSGSGAGGDLYGPGIYMADMPHISEGYLRSGKRQATWEELQNYYKPGRIVDSYSGGKDKVLQFDPGGSEGNWKVLVQAVDAKGQAAYGEYPRWHHTSPSVPMTPHLRQVYADIRKPFDIQGETPGPQVEQLLSLAGITGPARHNILWGNPKAVRNDLLYRTLTSHAEGDKTAVTQILQRAGYDGIVHTGNQGKGPNRNYIAFSDKQVYPTFGLDAGMQALEQPRYMPGLSEILPRLSQPQPPQGQ